MICVVTGSMFKVIGSIYIVSEGSTAGRSAKSKLDLMLLSLPLVSQRLCGSEMPIVHFDLGTTCSIVAVLMSNFRGRYMSKSPLHSSRAVLTDADTLIAR